MFERLQDRLDSALKTLKGQGSITEVNIATTLKEIRRALVDADVNYKIAKAVTDDIKQKAIGAGVLKSVNPSQQFVKIVHDELVELMGGEKAEVNLEGKPPIILLAGLQGSGKTTFSAKLASFLKKKGRKPLLIAADVYRPAAITQLKVMGESINVDVYSEEDNKDPVQIAKNGLAHARQNGHSLVIIDTAGRLSVDEQMMNEISRLKQELNPQEVLFVVDAMTGQDAVNTAKAFNERLDFDGVVLTKLDGDTRGGAALSIKTEVNKPIKFVGTGEKPDAIDYFYPERMAQRILGMGDIVSFVERAQDTIDQEEAERLQKKFRKNQFDFEDFLSQLKQIKRMGNLKDLMTMIPGMGKMVKEEDIDENAFRQTEAIIQSMTVHERRNPDVLNGSRRKRIADGSGTDVKQVNQVITQLNEMRKMMKMMNKMGGTGKGMPKLPFFN